LEELVRAHPKDDEMLVELAASLVEHAATLPDKAAAGQERLRARDILNKASDLGNASALAMNLTQLLRQLPAKGDIMFSDNPKVDQVMRSGEAAFSRRDFATAIKHYTNALALEPTNYSAALFTANAYDKENEFAEGTEWYKRAIQIEPNVETAYRYYADMLARQGAMGRARTMLIQAAVAEPYNRIVWRELHAWAALTKTHINAVYISIPPDEDNQRVPGDHRPPSAASVWQAYREVRVKWRDGDEFKRRFPEEGPYRHSLPEEAEALTAAAKALDGIKQSKDTAELIARSEPLALLLDLRQAGLIEPYVLFSLGDAGIARDYAAYRARSRSRLEEYLDRYVVPAVR
jgi:tetratricopeptide (TPR) repeat protein